MLIRTVETVWRKFAALVVTGMIACAGTPSAPARAEAPPALLAAGEHGEEVYDALRAGHWSRAKSATRALLAAGPNLIQPGSSESKSLAKTVGRLLRAVHARDRLAAMRAANRVTYWVAQGAAADHPVIPTAVVLLDFYGREVQIAAETGDPNELKIGLAGIQHCWHDARPLAQTQRNAAAAVEKFDDLVARLENARTSQEQAALATVLLEAVDALEKLFEG